MMYEYKVEVCKVKEAAGIMNRFAAEGWRVIAVSPDIGAGFGVVVTYERQVPDTPYYGQRHSNEGSKF